MHRLRPRRWSRVQVACSPEAARLVRAPPATGVEAGAGGSATTRRDQAPVTAPIACATYRIQDQPFQNDIFYVTWFRSAIFPSIAYREQ
ncbi:unnamed protein product [Miscanthus lutarioriparius]|uniref:Uncharacterized protein n=1 Tax=Miscanthus lutarioriparius TaxID=422564 RepID=A0A811N6S2_9POAL|nr:unnamed protein product [Miscanthus lutarioriparius]